MRAFTHCINARNVNEAFEYALRQMPYSARPDGSRNGNVLVNTEPVVTCYAHPDQRVLFSPMRDVNPFFHLMEALWMLAGRDDVAYPVMFNSQFGQFSDDGERFWGAYGYRWRRWFGYDQLDIIINELTRDPLSRRCVLAMWSPSHLVYPAGEGNVGMVQPDLMQAVAGGKDIPCNTHVYFRVQDIGNGPQLDMMVNCRSNDIFWGAYGANAVHFSVLQEYVASSLGAALGRYWQSSFNFHAYTDKFPLATFKDHADEARRYDFYKSNEAAPYPLMVAPRDLWEKDLARFMEWSEGDLNKPEEYFDNFFNTVAVPMRLAWAAFKQKDFPAALMRCEQIAATDWRIGCRLWINRRREIHERKQNG